MTEQQMIKMLVSKVQNYEAQIRDLKSQIRVYSLESEKAKGGLQVRRESMANVESLRDAVSALLNIIENNHSQVEFDKAVIFAKKVQFLTEGQSY